MRALWKCSLTRGIRHNPRETMSSRNEPAVRDEDGPDSIGPNTSRTGMGTAVCEHLLTSLEFAS